MLVGDALGVPYEFHDRQSIPPTEKIEFEPPDDFRRAHVGVAPGTWSDDGAQALCLTASLLERGRFDAGDLAEKIVRWYREDYLAVDGVFDVGNQTLRAILNLRKGVPPLEAGPKDEDKNGNGSLMRALPLALWHRGTDEELVADARSQSLVTHGHLRSQLCCAIYCLWARRTLEGSPAPWDDAVFEIRRIFPDRSAEREEMETHILPDDPREPVGSGYVVDSLFSAKWACSNPDFESIVKAAISLGDDTDTTACIAGGIAGIRFGFDAIPLRWRENLRGRELYQPLLEKLIERV